jgi:endoglycosylceramidase
LRGFVTINRNSDGSAVDYTFEDYRRMRSLGANSQSIRLGMGLLGFERGGIADPHYLERLQSMVQLARQVGMYSEFKLTTYDVPGFSSRSGESAWTQFWDNAGGSQDRAIAAWLNVWRLFKNEPAVVGYDLLNEPQKGTLGVDDASFVATYVNPFYQMAIDQLRAIDAQHLAFFQPPYLAREGQYLPYGPYAASIARPRVVYAPHFYPNLTGYLRNKDYSTAQYASAFQRYVNEAQANNAPLFIGEYAMPWDPKNDGNAALENKYQVLEKAQTNLFIQNGVGFTRPWYADDRAGTTIGQFTLSHALIRGRSLKGPLRTFITDVFSAAVSHNQVV